MIVIDASFAIDFLLHSSANPQILKVIETQDKLAAPSLIDYEVGSVLRRYMIKGEIGAQRAFDAFSDFNAMRLDVFEARQLLKRSWELRNNMTFYDASYVALAEQLDVPLYTTDKRLAAAPGHSARIVCLS